MLNIKIYNVKYEIFESQKQFLNELQNLKVRLSFKSQNYYFLRDKQKNLYKTLI